MASSNCLFDYDVAVSFAGEDRAIVEQFVTQLRGAGFKVFYDQWEQSSLWGKDLYQHLHEVYSQRARYCVVFVSAAYAAKLWTNHELQSAQERAFKENTEYILPVRLDDSSIPGVRDTVAYLDHRQLGIEPIANLAIEKIRSEKAGRANGLPRRRARTKKEARSAARGSDVGPGGKAKAAAKPAVVESSGDWILLADRFYQTEAVERPDEKRFVVSMRTTDAMADAALEAVRDKRTSGGRGTSFAYANDAFLVRCESATSRYDGNAHEWRIVLCSEEAQYGGSAMETSYSDGTRYYSPEDFAQMRAERILFGAHMAPPNRGTGYDVSNALIESSIQGTNTRLKVTVSPIQELAKKMPRKDVIQFLRCARLLTLFYLKAGDVVERVERLTLGPISGQSVHVVFRGRRREKYSNVDPHVIELEGECPLP
jgi:hypothetical protein